jgi:hypothetical protein
VVPAHRLHHATAGAAALSPDCLTAGSHSCAPSATSRSARSQRSSLQHPWLCGREGSASLHDRMGWLTGGLHRLSRHQLAFLRTPQTAQTSSNSAQYTTGYLRRCIQHVRLGKAYRLGKYIDFPQHDDMLVNCVTNVGGGVRALLGLL